MILKKINYYRPTLIESFKRGLLIGKGPLTHGALCCFVVSLARKQLQRSTCGYVHTNRSPSSIHGLDVRLFVHSSPRFPFPILHLLMGYK